MLTPRQRIEKQMAHCSLTDLYRALTRLKSPLTMMNTGAHPDDEQSGMLAYFSLGLGMRVIVGCSTRGEGGQNVLGPERLGALGVLRTIEMQEAARVLDADIHWLGHGPDDPVHDFGFSKDGDGTFAHWGEERTVERLVRAYRQERPDIVIPTFLDVPGQHGHHRAMTRAAETALALAADESAYPEHLAEGLQPWKVAKYYLPAWSGGGGTYDDTLPPPDATVTVTASGKDFATGAPFDRLGEASRYYHASQGMGYWPQSPKTTWSLHLLHGPNGSNAETSILDDLPTSLEDLCKRSDDFAELRGLLAKADEAIDTAIAAFPNQADIRASLVAAAQAINEAQTAAPDPFTALHGHRLERKLVEIDAALFECAELFERACAADDILTPGGSTQLDVVLSPEANSDVSVTLSAPEGVSSRLLASYKGIFCFALDAATDATFSKQYPPSWSSLGGNGPTSVILEADFDGWHAKRAFDLEMPLPVVPAHSVAIKPDAILFSLRETSGPMMIDVEIRGDKAPLTFEAPEGWQVEPAGDHWTIYPPANFAAGLSHITPMIGNQPSFNVSPISYAHIGKSRFIRREALDILALDLQLPKAAKVGYVGGGADNVAKWLLRMGADVTELDASALAGDLSAYTTIVVGIFAFGTRPDLADATNKLHQFVEAGGHLVTLYHRPSDGWDPEKTPPLSLTIGSPSLRWRVTDPKAEVIILEPEHPLLKGPNAIGPDDWSGWNKERGLYFASRWDDAYLPLLSMHDPEEQPLTGALVSARIGKGRHTHTSLVLHHQMDRLVPGAFRLMANLLQPA
ncbi:PIG-L family deacetylase [uncultured Cohaesibacter sp.]|uniref:PIG-L family deacetylase n=1 Tax=uncultured Cohaesibacter sp. TaxID=1002546 RepID=UPI0029C993FF|nr:PIG-L family deacetylase [uncultured Cohaesibacter sp.]